MSFEAFTAAGLYDPNDPKAHERRELLQHLLDRGFSADTIIETTKTSPTFNYRHTMHGIAAELQAYHPEEYLTPADVAQRCGATTDEVEELRTAFGLLAFRPDGKDIHGTFVADFALYQLAAEVYGKERALAFARVVGAAVAAMVEGARELAVAPLQPGEMSELELSQAIEVGGAAFESLKALVVHLLNEYVERDTAFSDDLIDGGLVMAVAFVDLVGSTEWTAQVSATEHALAIARFETTAARLAVQHGARVVKCLGDAAMIVGRSATGVAGAAASLCVATSDDPDLPDARGAVTWGPVQTQGGDYYGELVNLAARATKEAPAGGIVVTSAVAGVLDPSSWSLGTARAASLRGIAAEVELVEAMLR